MLFWVLGFCDIYLVVQYVSVPNPPRVDCDGSIAGKSIALKLAAPHEQLAEDLTVAEHILIGLG